MASASLAPYRATEVPPVVVECAVEERRRIVTITGDEIVWAEPVARARTLSLEPDPEPRELARVALRDVRRVHLHRLGRQVFCQLAIADGTHRAIEDDRDRQRIDTVMRTLHERLRGEGEVEFRIGSWGGVGFYLVLGLAFAAAAVALAMGWWQLAADYRNKVVLGFAAVCALAAPILAWRSRPRPFAPGARDQW